MDEREGFYFHRSFWDAIEQLPVKDQLPILKAIIILGLFGEEPVKMSPTQNAFYLLGRPVILKGRNKAANGRKGGSKKEANRKQNESKNESASDLPLSDNNSDSESVTDSVTDKGVILTDYDKGQGTKGQGSVPSEHDKGYGEAKADKPPARNRFVPPSADEVREYCREQGYTHVDPDYFVNYYTSKGWLVGKTKMKDWKAAVRGWESRDKSSRKENDWNKAHGVDKLRMMYEEEFGNG